VLFFGRAGEDMQVSIGCEFVIESSWPTPTAAIIQPYRSATAILLHEQYSLGPDLPLHIYTDTFGNNVWRFIAPVGSMRLRYEAIAEVAPTPDPVHMNLPGTLVGQLPDETLIYTLPSRYCPSDLVISTAWELFGSAPDGWARVQAICDWTHTNIEYSAGSSYATTSGFDAYMARKGVCRDFAHIAVMFCRAMNIPARYVCGYLPDIQVPINPTPMDFHAWFEAYIAGEWRTFDARHNYPRIGRVMIGHGRDAVDTAFMTSYGNSRLTEFTVWADEVTTERLFKAPEKLGERQG
jgi:transglutaminase-like putative cysteine protease